MFLLSDGPEYAPEICQTEHHCVWTLSRCREENAKAYCCGRYRGWELVLRESRLQFVQQVGLGWDAFRQAFVLVGLSPHLAGVAGFCQRDL